MKKVSVNSPLSSSLSITTIEGLSEQVFRFTASLNDDLVNGRVGGKHNTYAHRSLVLRQTKATLDLMRQNQRAEQGNHTCR